MPPQRRNDYRVRDQFLSKAFNRLEPLKPLVPRYTIIGKKHLDEAKKVPRFIRIESTMTPSTSVICVPMLPLSLSTFIAAMVSSSFPFGRLSVASRPLSRPTAFTKSCRSPTRPQFGRSDFPCRCLQADGQLCSDNELRECPIMGWEATIPDAPNTRSSDHKSMRDNRLRTDSHYVEMMSKPDLGKLLEVCSIEHRGNFVFLRPTIVYLVENRLDA